MFTSGTDILWPRLLIGRGQCGSGWDAVLSLGAGRSCWFVCVAGACWVADAARWRVRGSRLGRFGGPAFLSCSRWEPGGGAARGVGLPGVVGGHDPPVADGEQAG